MARSLVKIKDLFHNHISFSLHFIVVWLLLLCAFDNCAESCAPTCILLISHYYSSLVSVVAAVARARR